MKVISAVIFRSVIFRMIINWAEEYLITVGNGVKRCFLRLREEDVNGTKGGRAENRNQV